MTSVFANTTFGKLANCRCVPLQTGILLMRIPGYGAFGVNMHKDKTSSPSGRET